MQISCGLITPTIWGFRSWVTRTGTQYISPPIRRNPVHLSLKAQAPSFPASPSSHPFLPSFQEFPSPVLRAAAEREREGERSCLRLSVAICTRYVGRLCHELVYKSLHDDRPICDTRNPILPSWLRLRSTILVPPTWNRNCVNERWRYCENYRFWDCFHCFFWRERVIGEEFFFYFFNWWAVSFWGYFKKDKKMALFRWEFWIGVDRGWNFLSSFCL